MDNIPSSIIGYKKDAVDELLNKKDNLLETQQKDIDYLRKEIVRLEKNLQQKQKK